MQGATGLLQSRRFWTLLVDAVLSIALYFVGKYFAVALEDLRFLIIAIQPIAVALIAAYTIDDTQRATLANQLQMHTNSLNAQVETAKYSAMAAQAAAAR